MEEFKFEFTIKAKNKAEAQQKLSSLTMLASNISKENLKLMASKSTKSGINSMIPMGMKFL